MMTTTHNFRNKHNRSSSVTAPVRTAFFLNTGFIILEIIGGILTRSMAIISDALHDLGDSLSLGLAWYFQKLSAKKKDVKFSFGYRRFSLLGAVINSLVLLAGSAIILYETIPRLLHPEQPDARGMFILALLGVGINGLAAWRLKTGKSINEKVVSLHLLEDVLGWLAVLIGSGVMMVADVPVLDPVLSILITLYILTNVYRNLKTSFRVFLQGVPAATDLREVEKKILEFPEVESIHDIHLWSMDGQYNILTLHLNLNDQCNLQQGMDVKQRIKQSIKTLNIDHITIEIDRSGDECFLDECR